MAQAWRAGFPKCIAVIYSGNGLYEIKSYGSKEQMERYKPAFLGPGQTVTLYEHNGVDYIKI